MVLPVCEDSQCERHRMTRITGPERGYVQVVAVCTRIHVYDNNPQVRLMQ